MLELSEEILIRIVNDVGGGGNPQWIQDDGTNFDPFGTSRNLSFSSDTTSGSMIIAVYHGENSASLTVTDNKGNSFTTVEDGASSGISIAAAYNITGGSSHQITFNVTNNPNPGQIIILEYSGIATSSAFDVGGENQAFTANISVTTAATSQDVELLFAAYFGAQAPSSPDGFTLRHAEGLLRTQDGVSSSSGPQTIGFTHIEGTAGISVATFKAA
jgi:hypothetical protein